MAYHPQTNGQTERINQEIRTFLRHYVNYRQDNWTNWLAAIEFQYNNKKYIATGQTPFELNFGRHPWKGDLMVQTNIPQVEEFLMELQKSWEQTTKSIEDVQKNMKKQFNKKRRNPQRLRASDNVWLENKNIHSNRPSKKLNNKRYRPFKISKNIGLEVFELELPEGWMIHNVWSRSSMDSTRTQHLSQQLLIKKKNMKLKKSGSIENKEGECNT